MKKIIYKLSLLCVICTALAACTDDFADINSNPTTVYDINPNNHFLKACQIMNNSSFEFYYDYCPELVWLQYTVNNTGNGATAFDWDSNMGDRYGRFVSAGGYIKDIPEYIKAKMSTAEQANYRDLIEISKILLIYYGIYSSDTYGSLVYDEGWQARYGGISNPAFQSQENLYNEWDQQLKDAIAALKQSNSTQVPLGGYDPVYGGDTKKWIKAANALRLRMANRWMKRDLNKAKTIAAEVLGSSDIFSSNADGWVFIFENNFTTHENFNRIASFRGSLSMVNFMTANNDPRLRLFYQKNMYSPENVALWNDQNPSSKIVYNPQQYVGGHSNPSGKSAIKTPEYYSVLRKVKQANGSEITLDTLSRTQERLFYAQANSGKGISWMPGITYADFCFMAAEFAYLGVSSPKNTQQWYEDGIKSSISLYNTLAERSQVEDYQAITESEINAYMQNPVVAWNPSKALDKIYCQSFINFFKNVNESWSLWKRTGYPNTTSILPVEALSSDLGESIVISRRQPLNYPLEGTVNYDNYKKRIDDMAKDPDYGEPNDSKGRIWWDKK